MSSNTNLSYGPVSGPPAREISRRTFMRRMLGAGMGLLSLEFLGGTLAFLWPNLTRRLRWQGRCSARRRTS